MYMSPEQAEGERAGPASDLYSLGVVAYEMLTGRPPFTGETPLALLRAHVDKPLPPPRRLNPALPEARRGGPVQDPGEGPGPPISVGRGVRDGAPLGVRPGAAAQPGFARRRRRATGRGNRAAIRGRRGRGQPGAAAGTEPSADADAPPASLAAPTDATVPRRAMPPSAPPRLSGGSRLDEPGHQPRPLPPHEPPPWTRHVSRRNVLVGLGALAAAGAGVGALRWTGAWPAPIRTVAVQLGVSTIAFAPYGDILATVTSSNSVQLWQVADGAWLRTLLGHTDSVSGVAFSPDGTLLVSSSEDRTVRVWRVADGVTLNTFVEHAAPVSSVAFSPDGQLIASAGNDFTVRLWRAQDRIEIRAIPIPNRLVTSRRVLAGRPTRGHRLQRRCHPPVPGSGWRRDSPAPGAHQRGERAGQPLMTWRSRRTGGCWRPARTTRRCGSGAWPTARCTARTPGIPIW